ncbi:MAG: DUF2520 domain-containing protein [Tannerella sp.]|jgi:predicted short-subunit dehydrogenase-like oxidoreductase (DUF2520 family)|nr:DUF2520 domain-containing protein [Tannerella sp.]
MKVVSIGSGNVAVHLLPALQRAGCETVQVYSRSEARARALAGRLGAAWTADAGRIRTDADLYVFAVTDDALPELAARIPPNGGLWIHTAGSVPMDVFKGRAGRYGVLYPLQTFSGSRTTDFRRIPCFVEACRPDDETLLFRLAAQLSDCVRTLASDRRKYLHLAAVFACNFSNHMYALAGRILAEQGLPADVLIPLVDETAAKIHDLTPRQAQTGPAVRNDRNVIERHLSLLTDPDMKEIYQLLSHHIYKETRHE